LLHRGFIVALFIHCPAMHALACIRGGLPLFANWGRRAEPVAARCIPRPAPPAGSVRRPGLYVRIHAPPGYDLAAEDVHDQVEVEEHASDRPGHPGYVPSPSSCCPPPLSCLFNALSGNRQRMSGCARVRPRRAHLPDSGWVVCAEPAAWPGHGDAAGHPRVRHALEAGLRRQIPPLIRQFRHDPAWWQTAEFP